MRYFSIDEFRCKHCWELPSGGMNPVLLQKLDNLRATIGMPVIVSCGYRCPSHNAEVGGVWNSQHVYGNAADIYVNGMDVDTLASYCEDQGFDGIGIYYPGNGDFVHVDVRDNGNSPGYYRW